MSALAVWLVSTAACVPSAAVGRAERAERSGTDTVRILAYNIRHGEGMDGRVDLERVAELIRRLDPDLVALQEVDSATERTGRVDQARELGRLTGLAWRFGSFMPYQGGAYGMAVLSRLPITAAVNHRLPPGAEPRSSLAVRVLLPRSQIELRLVGVHFYRTEEERLAQARSLEEQLGRSDVPTILAGDFNSRPDSPVMALLDGSWNILRKGADRFTFPSDDPDREIDYVLLPADAEVRVLGHEVLDEPLVSDHRPLIVDLVIGA